MESILELSSFRRQNRNVRNQLRGWGEPMPLQGGSNQLRAARSSNSIYGSNAPTGTSNNSSSSRNSFSRRNSYSRRRLSNSSDAVSSLSADMSTSRGRARDASRGRALIVSDILVMHEYACRQSYTELRKKPQWEQVSKVKLFEVREDFYSTQLSSYNSWVRNPWDSLPLDTWNAEVRRLASAVRQDGVYAVGRYALQSWSTQQGHHALPDPLRGFIPMRTVSTCIAQSKLGFLVICYQNGLISVTDLLDDTISSISLDLAVDKYNQRLQWGKHEDEAPQLNRGSLFDARSEHTAATHIIWAHETRATSDSTHICRLGRVVEGFLGDQLGRVFKFALQKDGRSFSIVIVAAVDVDRYHRDSVCSMALNADESRLAVAGTDNVVRVWKHCPDAVDPRSVLVFETDLPQFSAVRAIAFCPAFPTMVVTGGGRHDRTLRMFDVHRQEPDFQIKMPAQIVGLVWLSKTEVFVGLGHSRLRKYRGLGKVVDISTGQTIAEIPGEGYLLSALKTQHGFCVNTSQSELIAFTWTPSSPTPADPSRASDTPQLR